MKNLKEFTNEGLSLHCQWYSGVFKPKFHMTWWLCTLNYWVIRNLLLDIIWFLLYCGSRQAGHRIGEHLQKVIPLVVKFSQVEDDELREYCLQAFESFVRRCPKDISPHIPMVDLYSQHCSFLSRISRLTQTDARYWYSKSVCPFVCLSV